MTNVMTQLDKCVSVGGSRKQRGWAGWGRVGQGGAGVMERNGRGNVLQDFDVLQISHDCWNNNDLVMTMQIK